MATARAAALYISTHAPHTGSDGFGLASARGKRISTHAPHTGSDRQQDRCTTMIGYFNSRSPYGERSGESGTAGMCDAFQLTLPIRGAMRPGIRALVPVEISTHAPHTGSDRFLENGRRHHADFNSRSPYGERSSRGTRRAARRNFNSRSPYGERSTCFSLPLSWV